MMLWARHCLDVVKGTKFLSPPKKLLGGIVNLERFLDRGAEPSEV